MRMCKNLRNFCTKKNLFRNSAICYNLWHEFPAFPRNLYQSFIMTFALRSSGISSIAYRNAVFGIDLLFLMT